MKTFSLGLNTYEAGIMVNGEDFPRVLLFESEELFGTEQYFIDFYTAMEDYGVRDFIIEYMELAGIRR